jgi:hypothetical protein
MMLVAIAVVALIFWSVLRNHRAIFAWVIIAGYELVNTLLLGISRSAFFGPIIGSEYRYATDAAIVAVVFGSMAFLRTRDDFGADPILPLVPRRSSAGLQVLPAATGELAVAGLLTCALMVSGMFSTARAEPIWRNTQARLYFHHVAQDIRNARRSIPIADEYIGNKVQGGLLVAYSTPSAMFAGFRPKPTFLMPGSATSSLYLPDDQGRLREAKLIGLSDAPGPDAECGWRVGERGATIRLTKRTLAWRWTVRMGYLSNGESETTVTAGTMTTRVRIYPGVGQLFVMGFGEFDSVQVGPLRKGVSFCTADVHVGNAVPAPGTHP